MSKIPKAEDLQPNEGRVVPKGSGVPVIHPTRPAHPPSFRRPFRGDRWSNSRRFHTGRSHFGPSAPPEDHDHSRLSADRHLGFHSKPARPILPHSSPSTQSPDTPILVVPGSTSTAQNTENHSRGSRQLADAGSIIRQGAKENKINKRPEPIDPEEKEVTKKSKFLKKSGGRLGERQTIEFDLPEHCRKGAAGSHTSRIRFKNKTVNDMRSRMSALINEHFIKDDKLVIIYSLLLDMDNGKSPVAKSHPTPRKPHPSARISDTEGDKSHQSVPSGSNVKLEDTEMPFSPVDSHTPQTKCLVPNRPFRSGILSLTYGPPPRVVLRDKPPAISSALPLLSMPSDRLTKVPYRNSRGGPSNVPTPEVIETVPIDRALSTSSKHTQLSDSPIVIDDSPPCSPKPDADGADFEESDALHNTKKRVLTSCVRLTEEGDVVRLPKDSYDKPRRLLISSAQHMSYLMSAHGTVHEITQELPRRQREFRSAQDPFRGVVDDICLLSPPFDDVAVVGQSFEDNALSLIHFSDDANQRFTALERMSVNPDRRVRGVSAVHALINEPLSFVSGGYDHVVHLWTLDDSLHPAKAESRVINMMHSSMVQSFLSVDDTSPKLLSAGADCCVNVWDLPSERTLNTIRTSNSVYQLHRTTRPECALLEVAHRDSQFELHDYRAFVGRPAQRFGFNSAHVQGRFNRGDVSVRGGVCTFASGGRDGRVRLWDLRNTGRCRQEILCFSGQKIAQAVFDENYLVVVSEDNRLMYLKICEG